MNFILPKFGGTERGRTWWDTPVMSAAWEAEAHRPLEPGVQGQPGLHGETLSQAKQNKKLFQNICGVV